MRVVKRMLLASCAALWAGAARADIILSANDAHSLNINGVGSTAKDPPPDNLAVIDMAQTPPKIIATIDAPTSVAGPPMAVALSLTLDRRFSACGLNAAMAVSMVARRCS